MKDDELMKIIGIIGKSGSGKTTLSRMLQKNDSIGVIHLDEVTSFKTIVKRIPKKITKSYTNNIGEEKIVLNKKITNFIYKLRKNKFLDKIYSSLLKIPRELIMSKQIKKFQKMGKKAIIIERMHIRVIFSI